MLQIKGVSKTYHTGSLVQKALNRVNLNLRDNEFVAILGQSGSGKTTLLNIIGGLDRYDEGDLIINGISTKKYSDRDWDSYRNHTVGFVFQSYNLIPHQSILANVELALTIGGISRKERTRRALAALEQVGLSQHVHKKPSQLSGGQMQRVAIARALVNDPDILLADEPTGALDSETSIQVMDLLKEVARDRLVVMVTHNPELAEQYATRIVRLKDGEIQADSDPFEPETAEGTHRNMGRASMSFLTSLLLSFNNLWTKKTRTILVAFAGSIGIIGIALIMSLSAGVNKYITETQGETLQGYPLQISSTSYDFTSLMNPSRGPEAKEPEKIQGIRERKVISNLMSTTTSNDLKSLKQYLESDECDIYQYVQDIEYSYSVTPQIFLEKDGDLHQVHPNKSFNALGFGGMENLPGMFSGMNMVNSFYVLPRDPSLYESKYEVLAGHWPENSGEFVLIMQYRNTVSDLVLYLLGMKDPKRLDEMLQTFMDGNSVTEDEEPAVYAYEDFLGIRLKAVPASDFYQYDPEYKVWTDKSDDKSYLRKIVDQGKDMTLVGVVQLKEDEEDHVLSGGLWYPESLERELMEDSVRSEIVQAQLSDPEVDVFSGLAFGEKPEREDMDMSHLFSVDEQAIEDAFTYEAPDQEIDWSQYDFSEMDMSALDMSDLDYSGISLPSLSNEDVARLMGSLNVQISSERMESLFRTMVDGYMAYAAQDPSTDYARLGQAVQEYLNSEGAQTMIQTDVQQLVDQVSSSVLTTERLEEVFMEVLEGFPAYAAANPVIDPETGEPADSSLLLDAYLQSPEAQAILAAQVQAMQAQMVEPLLDQQALADIPAHLLAGYQTYATENSLPDPALMRESFAGYLATGQAQAMLAAGVSQAVDTSELERQATEMFASYSTALSNQIGSLMEQVVTRLTNAVVETMTDNMGKFLEQLSENFTNAFELDPEALAKAFTMNFSGEELRSLMESLMATESGTYTSNLRKLGYADPDTPESISIYPIDFESKARIKEILNEYNDNQMKAGEEEKVITYMDMVDALMSSVTDMINSLSYVLIAFVGISLVVSSIMIGVITYISVLERQKEIGILRAIGASKRNISQVFNAETFIIGALAGLIGIGISYLLHIPMNHILHTMAETDQINALLKPTSALLLVGLSILLTMIGGIIPSQKASRSDPVAALRSE